MARKIQPKSRTPRPKPGQSSEEYWRERETRQRAANIRDEVRLAERINSIFQSTQDNIEQEIESFYQRYAAKEGIDIAEAKRRVSKIDMEKYERLAKQYVKVAHEGGADVAFSDEANEQMRLYNATMRINRLEMLKARCGIRAMEGYSKTQQLINDELEERAYSEYERLAGILGNSVQFNENMVRSIVNASYQNATWSQRLWRNQALLSEQIGAQLAQGILTGKSSRVLAANIQKLTGGSAYACQRLMRTEMRRVQTAAAEQSMRDNGVTEYKYMVVNGVNPCDDCLDLDGQVFKVSEMTVGVNAPPRHPSCHCATSPHVDEAKWQRWLESGTEVPWEEFESDTGANGQNLEIDYREVLRNEDNPVNISTREGDIVATPLMNSRNNIYLSNRATLKRRELHLIEQQIDIAKRVTGFSKENSPRYVIVSDTELGNTTGGRFDAKTNTVYIKQMIDKDKQLYVIVHESFHGKDYRDYVAKGGVFKDNNSYIAEISRRSKPKLDKAGVTADNVSEISPYAKTMYRIGRYDETYTELRTSNALKGG